MTRPGGQDELSRRGRLSHVSKGARWLTATVATAAIGVVVAAVVGGWLEPNDNDQPAVTSAPLPFPQSRLISAERIGLYRVEAGADADDAILVFGQPTDRERTEPGACDLTWQPLGLVMAFGNLAGQDPCTEGTFCEARISGDQWGTTRGLQVGEPVSRIRELYKQAEQVREPGAIVRFVLEPGAAPCGRDAEGGLEAWTASGRIFSLVVTHAAGGD